MLFEFFGSDSRIIGGSRGGVSASVDGLAVRQIDHKISHLDEVGGFLQCNHLLLVVQALVDPILDG